MAALWDTNTINKNSFLEKNDDAPFAAQMSHRPEVLVVVVVKKVMHAILPRSFMCITWPRSSPTRTLVFLMCIPRSRYTQFSPDRYALPGHGRLPHGLVLRIEHTGEGDQRQPHPGELWERADRPQRQLLQVWEVQQDVGEARERSSVMCATWPDVRRCG